MRIRPQCRLRAHGKFGGPSVFPLVRYFSIISGVAILTLTLGLTALYWQTTFENLVQRTQDQNKVLARALSNAFPGGIDGMITARSPAALGMPAHQGQRRAMDEHLRQVVRETPVLKAKLYTDAGLTVYSSNPADIGTQTSNDTAFPQVIAALESVSETSFRETFVGFYGAVSDRHLVETYIPVLGQDGQIRWVFELYTDITGPVMARRHDSAIAAALLLLALALLYGVLFVVVKRASGRLEAQYQTLTRTIEQLKRSEQRFVDFAEASSDWLWEMGPDLRFTYLSERVKEATGVSAAEHIGKTREELSGEGIKSTKWRELADTLKTQQPFRNFEYARRGPDGAMQYLSISGAPIFDATGAFQGYRGSGKEVTPHRNALDRAQRAEQTLRTAIESIDEAFVLYDADDRLVLCNEKYREFYSLSYDLIVPGQRFEDLLREGVRRGQFAEAIGREEDWLAERLASHALGNTTIEQQLGDGRWLRIAETKTPDGGTVGFRVDITQLKQAQQAAEAANLSKSEFLATMSHEIRTPMTGVLGFADLLMHDNLPPASIEKVVWIKEAAKSLLSIITDILDISKMEAGKLEIEALNFQPCALAETVVALCRNTCPPDKQKRVEISWSVDGPFPEVVQADPTRLRQILINLVGNAVKFTDQGFVRLICSADTARQQLQFDIFDSGIGIKADVLPKLFDEFVQADASISRRYEGTGLGLTICQRLSELLGGTIAVESTLGQGTRFTVTIPYAPATGKATALSEVREPAQKITTSRPLKVLIAEDNQINQLMIRTLIEGMGHQAAIVQDGEAAVAAVRDGQFDLVLMDVRMPVMAGPEAARLIRRLPGDAGRIPIIALTADAMEEHRKSYRQAGMDYCVAKPIDTEQLAEVVLQATSGLEGVTDLDLPPAPARTDPPLSEQQQRAMDDALADVFSTLKKLDD